MASIEASLPSRAYSSVGLFLGVVFSVAFLITVTKIPVVRQFKGERIYFGSAHCSWLRWLWASVRQVVMVGECEGDTVFLLVDSKWSTRDWELGICFRNPQCPASFSLVSSSEASSTSSNSTISSGAEHSMWAYGRYFVFKPWLIFYEFGQM